MQSAIEFHATLTEAVKSSSHETRSLRKIKVGQCARQGDVYIHRIKDIPESWNVAVTEHRQVAVGDTIGSRHIADGAALSVLWPKSRQEAMAQCPIAGLVEKLGRGAEFCLGPAINATEPWCLTHPEHAHHEFPAGKYLVTYQLNWTEQRAVRD